MYYYYSSSQGFYIWKYKYKDSVKQLLIADPIIAHHDVGAEFLPGILTLSYFILYFILLEFIRN